MRVVDTLIGAVPFRPALLRTAARIPPPLRSRPSYRVLAAMARRTPDCRQLGTNLGIATRLRCVVPIEHPVAIFGKPAFYSGERGALELARRLADRSDAFVDVGAHLGYFTFYVRALASRSVPIHYFEPDPDLFARLEQNVRANALAGVTGHNEAIGEADGTALFYINRSDTFSGSLTDMFSGKHEIVPAQVTTRRFASFASTAHFTRACVKVDVEGAERQFLDGAIPVLDRVAYLIMEVLGPAVTSGFVADLMREGGFHGYYINDYSLEQSLDGSFTYREPEYNWLFCREAPPELRRTLAGSRFRIKG